MGALTRPYLHLVRTNMVRRDVLVAAATMFLFVLVVVTALGSLWSTAFPDGATAGGYTSQQLVWYVAIAETAVVSVAARLMLIVGDRIRDGEAAILLLRPVTLPFYLIAEELGASLGRMCLVLPGSCLVAWLLAGPPPSIPGLAWALVSLPVAMALSIAATVTVGALTFWLGESRAAWFLYQKLIFLAGGMLLPLEFWPPQVAEVLRLMPWASMAYAPARLAATGSLVEAARIIPLQLAWLAVMLATAVLTYRRGERRMVVAGG